LINKIEETTSLNIWIKLVLNLRRLFLTFN
jgi:hypothetical protein